jgi:chaperonin GroEL
MNDQTRGVDIVRQALMAPVRQIATNAGVDGAVVSGKLLREGDETRASTRLPTPTRTWCLPA